MPRQIMYVNCKKLLLIFVISIVVKVVGSYKEQLWSVISQ